MVELCVLLCESFSKENVPVNGVAIPVAGANYMSDIMGNIEGITKMAQRASYELKKPCFCGVTITVESEKFIAGCKEGSTMDLSEKSINDCIGFILAKVFDERVVVPTDPVDNLLKRLGITRMDDTNNGQFGN